MSEAVACALDSLLPEASTSARGNERFFSDFSVRRRSIALSDWVGDGVRHGADENVPFRRLMGGLQGLGVGEAFWDVGPYQAGSVPLRTFAARPAHGSDTGRLWSLTYSLPLSPLVSLSVYPPFRAGQAPLVPALAISTPRFSWAGVRPPPSCEAHCRKRPSHTGVFYSVQVLCQNRVLQAAGTKGPITVFRGVCGGVARRGGCRSRASNRRDVYRKHHEGGGKRTCFTSALQSIG